MKRWAVRLLLAAGGLYLALGGVVMAAMMQPPARFGSVMKRMPPAVVWGLLPSRSMWLWARRGSVQPGEAAPEFTLSRHDRSGSVSLSQHRGQPVVLVFGSYT